MPYFLGIVAEDDVKRGIFRPSYVLYKKSKSSGIKSDYIIYRANVLKSKPWITYTLIGHNNLIEFMSGYRTRDEPFGSENDAKYYPRGILCWFECKKNGKLLPNKPVILIKRVPDKEHIRKHRTDSGLKRLKEYEEAQKLLKNALTKDDKVAEYKESSVKPKLDKTVVYYVRKRLNWKQNILDTQFRKRE